MKKTLVIVLAVLIIGSGGYYLARKFGFIRDTTPSDIVSPITANGSSISVPTDWKTYRNDTLGFEFKYPPDLYPDSYGNGNKSTSERFLVSFQKENKSNPAVQFSIIDFSNAKPYVERFPCVKNEIVCSHSVVKNYFIGSSRARTLNYSVKGGTQMFVEVFHKGSTYEFLVFGTDSNLIEHMAETLKFDDEPMIDISSWKTYSKEEYGFEFKYPSDIFALTEANNTGIKLISKDKLPGGISFIFVNKPIKNVADASAEKIIVADKEALERSMGVEGEGINTYYLPINRDKTLIVERLYGLVDEGASTFPSIQVFLRILSTFKFTK